jgi:hypothetical protein
MLPALHFSALVWGMRDPTSNLLLESRAALTTGSHTQSTLPALAHTRVALRGSFCTYLPVLLPPAKHHCAPTDLVNDAGAWLPETNAVLGSRGGQEVIHLLVGLDSVLEVGSAAV